MTFFMSPRVANSATLLRKDNNKNYEIGKMKIKIERCQALPFVHASVVAVAEAHLASPVQELFEILLRRMFNDSLARRTVMTLKSS